MGISYSIVGGYGCPIRKIDADTEEKLTERLADLDMQIVLVGSSMMGTAIQWLVDNDTVIHYNVREHSGLVYDAASPKPKSEDHWPAIAIENLLKLEPTSAPRWFVGIWVS